MGVMSLPTNGLLKRSYNRKLALEAPTEKHHHQQQQQQQQNKHQQNKNRTKQNKRTTKNCF